MFGIVVLQKLLLLGALFAVMITLLATPMAVGVFRRKVAVSMNRASHGGDIPDGSEASAPRPAFPAAQSALPRLRAGAALQPNPRESALARPARDKLQRIALAYACGGVAQAAAITPVLLLGGADIYTGVATWLPVLIVLSLPVVPTVSHVLATRPAVRALWAVGALTVALIVAGSARQVVWRVFQLYILVPAVILLVFNLRYWRAAVPLIQVLAFGASLGWLVFLEIGKTIVGDGAGMWLFRLAGLAGGALLALPAARLIGGWHQRKCTSGQMLFIDIWWLLLTLIETIILVVTRGGLGQLIALGGFAAFWLVSRALIGGLRSDEPPAARLLLLRVFGHDRRIERLLDELTLRWRPLGTVELIAGRDLAFRNIDPSELYGFLTGGLAREFVKDDDDLAQRLARRDDRQDPDGLYRVSQYFCHRDTWQRTLDALVAGCDAVLMDLRGFDERRLGCQYEIGRLAERLGDKPIVLLTDSSTRVELAESLFLAAVSAERRAALRAAGVKDLHGARRQCTISSTAGARLPRIVQVGAGFSSISRQRGMARNLLQGCRHPRRLTTGEYVDAWLHRTNLTKEKQMKNHSVFLSALLGAAALAASADVFADPAPASFKGGVLVDSRGMTLYAFDKDPAGAGKSVCNAACAGVWPPLTAADGSAAGGDFSVFARDDGGKQIAHKGRPLYFYAADQKPGDMSGDNSGGVWHVVRSEPAKASQKPAGGSPYSTPGY